MKDQVLYSSKINPDNNDSGKKDAVKQVADALAIGAGLMASFIGNYSQIRDTQVLMIGCDVAGGKINASTHKNLLRVLKDAAPDSVKTVVVYSIMTKGDKTARDQIKAICEPKGITVAEEEFSCKGPTLFGNKDCPTDKDIADAKAFGLAMVTKYRDKTKGMTSVAVSRHNNIELV